MKFSRICETGQGNVEESGQGNKSEDDSQQLWLEPLREGNQAETVKYPVPDNYRQIVDTRHRIV